MGRKRDRSEQSRGMTNDERRRVLWSIERQDLGLHVVGDPPNLSEVLVTEILLTPFIGRGRTIRPANGDEVKAIKIRTHCTKERALLGLGDRLEEDKNALLRAVDQASCVVRRVGK